VTARFEFPHPVILLLGCIAVAAALTWVVPAGVYDRHEDPATGRALVVAGTYHRVDPAPVGVFQALVAVPRGLIDASSVIFLIFLSGGAFTVVDRTGALRRLVDVLARKLEGRGVLVIPVVGLAFVAGGALMQMQEELVAFAPLMLLICASLGLPPLIAVAMSLGTASIAAAFSPVDPFMVAIAQKVAQVPVGSGWEYRTVLLTIAMAYWLWSLTRYASRHLNPPAVTVTADERERALTGRHLMVIVVVLLTFLFFGIGAQQWGWDFDKLATLFLIMGLASGIIGGLGISGTADALVAGARDMTFSALIVGLARGIFVVLDEGHIVDSLVHAIVTPLEGLPVALAALGMFFAQALIHVPVPSTSGQAVLTMPILAPVSDLIGLSRQVTVLAYQLGNGTFDLLFPTNGPLLALLAVSGVRFDDWFKWALPRCLILAAFGCLAVVVAIAIGWH
jgi:uncharacterized ion transporter superfamily protein YfcC